MRNEHHQEILKSIQEQSSEGGGKPLLKPGLSRYLGTPNPQYPIRMPNLRTLAKDWASTHRDLSQGQFADLITSLVEEGESSTEKYVAGMLLDFATPEQRGFDPALFDRWLDHVVGWSEVDALCVGAYALAEIPANVDRWKPVLAGLARSDNIHKRRASLMLLSWPLSKSPNKSLAHIALENVDQLKAEEEGMIKKAVSCVLRSMIRRHRKLLYAYMEENHGTLPHIAVHQTKSKLTTGRKSRR